MSQSSKFIYGSMALLLISSSGCAGNGLKNMFSRNETAGYKTLEELEAERLEKENSSTDESGPRFASWMPFGRKASEEEQTVASSDSDSSEEKEESAAGGWWKNPFRRQETVEADPFLTDEKPVDVAAAGKEKTPSDPMEPSAPRRKAGVAENPKVEPKSEIRKVSSTKEPATAPETDDDTLLVEKFEKHFQQNTEEAVEKADDVSALIVAGKADKVAAGKKVAQKSSDLNATADDKLQEFEELLAQKKSSGKKTTSKAVAEAEDVFSGFEDAGKTVTESGRKEVQTAKAKASQSVETFDSLLADETPVAAPKKSRTKSKVARTEPKGFDDDVEVASADGIFGAQPRATEAKTEAASSSGGWSDASAEDNDINWSAAKKPSAQKRGELARKVLSSTVDQFAAAFEAARKSEQIPPAALPDATEAERSQTSGGYLPDSGKPNRKSGSPMHVASSSRQLPEPLEKPASLQQDSFFTTASSNSSSTGQSVRPIQTKELSKEVAVPEERLAGKSASSLPGLQFRTWLFLIGGIIVVALLFAPARKKPIQANQLPVQG